MTTSIISEIDAFVSAQNQNRGGTLPGGGVLPLDYDALTGTVPAGGNAVTGIAGIAAGAAVITLPTGQTGNAAIIDGAVSTSASTSGPDSYSFSVDATGKATITDNNTGNSETVTGASYLLFNGGATAYMIESGVNATLAAMYNAAFGREPDLPGLEFYIDQYGTKAAPDLHTVATYFINSTEFKTQYPGLQTTPDAGGPNDTAWVSAVYSAILHRTASASEIGFYTEALAGTLTVNGALQPAVDRATVFEYFTNSPENQADIAGWLINPAKGEVSFGAMSDQVANSVLTNEATAGTINAADFAGLSPTGQAIASVNGGSVTLLGTDFYGAQGTTPGFSVEVPNVTLNLSSEYYYGGIIAANVTINGPSGGGAMVSILNSPAGVNGAGIAYPGIDGSGTVNLSGNGNLIQTEGAGTGPLTAPPVTTVIHGWNSSDGIAGSYISYTPSAQMTALQAMLATQDGVLYQGSISSPISGATLGNGTWFSSHQVAINVGSIANDSVSTMVAAANQVYSVADIGTAGQSNSESAFFFGQDPQGNTMVFYWHGDSTKTHTVVASDIVGAVELVGVQASSLTSANFHL